MPLATPAAPARPARKAAKWPVTLGVIGGGVAVAVGLAVLVVWNPFRAKPKPAAAAAAPAAAARPPRPRPTLGPVVSADDARAQQALLDRLHEALRRRDFDGIVACFDFDRLIEEAGRDAGQPFKPLPTEASARRRELRNLVGDVSALVDRDVFDRYLLCRSRYTDGTAEAAAYGVSTQGRYAVSPARWWVCKSPEGWRVYDYEIVDLGFRLSRAHALDAEMKAAGTDSDLRHALAAIREADRSLGMFGGAAALAELSRTDVANLPPEVAALAANVTARAHARERDFAAATADVAKARAVNPDKPSLELVVAEAHLAAGAIEPAKAAIARYEDALAADDRSQSLLGDVHLARKDLDAARKAYRAALAFNSESYPALTGLCKLNGPQNMAEAIAAFRATNDQRQAYQAVCDEGARIRSAPLIEAGIKLNDSVYNAARVTDPYIEGKRALMNSLRQPATVPGR